MEKLDKTKQFITEARQELRKVTWPPRQQTISSTWVVMGVVFIISIFLGLVDFVLTRLVSYILS